MTVTLLPHAALAVAELTRPARGWLVGAPLNRCDAPTVTALCGSLVVRGGEEVTCGGLLAYQGGWQHVNVCLDCYDAGPCRGRVHVSCLDPAPAGCDHPHCGEPGDIDQDCAYGYGSCCGCCWIRDDQLEGRRT